MGRGHARCRGEATGGAAAGRRFLLTGVGLLAAGLVVWVGGPRARDYFAHVETDDAFVAGYTTAVGSRVSDVVEDVLVNDNDQVEKGTLAGTARPRAVPGSGRDGAGGAEKPDLLVQQMVKAVETDRAELANARLKVAAALAGLEEAWKAVEGRQEQVRYRVASLHAAAAAMRATQAEVVLAEKDHERIQNLVSRQSGTTAELDQRWATLVSAREKVKAAEQQVQQARAQLALPPDFKDPERVPADLERSDTEVRRAVAMGQQVLATLGVEFGRDLDPVAFQRLLQGLKARPPAGWIDRVPLVQVRAGEAGIVARGAGRYGVRPRVSRAAPERDESAEGARRRRAEAQLHRDPGARCRASSTAGRSTRATMCRPAGVAVDPAARRDLHRGQLQGDAARRPAIGQPVAISVDAYPDRIFHGPGLRASRRRPAPRRRSCRRRMPPATT